MADGSTSGQGQIKTPGGKPKKARRRGRGLLNLILIIGIIVAVGLFVWAEQQRRNVQSRLQQTEQQLEEIRTSTNRQGEEVAQQVLAQVRQHMDLPTDPQPTVATIIDVDRLRETSEFYAKAENGDHLIITTNRAILYDPDRDIIIDVVPVQINQGDQAGEQPAEGETPSPVPGEEDANDDTSPSPGASPTTSPSPEITPPTF